MKLSFLASPALLLVFSTPSGAAPVVEAALPLLPNGLAPVAPQDAYSTALARLEACRIQEAAARRRAARGEIGPAALKVFTDATAQAQAAIARLKKVPPPFLVPTALPVAPALPQTASPSVLPFVARPRQPFLATLPLAAPRTLEKPIAPPRLTSTSGVASAIAAPFSGFRSLPKATPRLMAALPAGTARIFVAPVAKPVEKPIARPLPAIAKAEIKPETKPLAKPDNKADLERLAKLEAELHRADRRLSAASDALTEGQKQLAGFAGTLRLAMLEAGPDAVGLHPFVKVAEKYAGTPYVWGGESRTGFDCSGMIIRVMRDLGYKALPHSAAEQFKYGKPIAEPLLKPGDLVFFANTYKAGISHVGIYLGKRRFIHAAGTGKGTIVSSLDERKFQEKYAGARRLIAAR